MAISHPGSWNLFGKTLPDFSVTERLSDLFGGTRNAQGGSQFSSWSTAPAQLKAQQNLAAQQSVLPAGARTVNGKVLGASTTALSGISGGSSSDGTSTDNSSNYNPAQDELNNLNSVYDYNAEQARNQLSSLSNQYNTSVNEANTNYDQVKNQITGTKTQNLSDIDRQIQSAGSTAQNTQMKNRNILRALGILNSSYAGESLNRPMEQFATQRNELMNMAQQRAQELDDALTSATTQHQQMLDSLKANYDQLVNQVNTDLRFNDRQRADAIKAVNNALAQNIYNLQQQQQSIVNQVSTQKTALAKALQSVNQYTTPQANLSNITAASEVPGQVKPISQQASILDPNQKKLSDLYL
jgi:hypothetical protein